MAQNNNPHTLGTESIGKLLLQYSIPAIIGMTVTSIYHIIDSIFIGHGVGPMAISGLAITFPFMNLVIALSARWLPEAVLLFIHQFGKKRHEQRYPHSGQYADALHHQCSSLRKYGLYFSG